MPVCIDLIGDHCLTVSDDVVDSPTGMLAREGTLDVSCSSPFTTENHGGPLGAEQADQKSRFSLTFAFLPIRSRR